MIHARPLALKAAESLAAEARKTKKLLKQAFADRPDLHVVLPPPFSWITFGNVPLGSAPNAARLSTVAGVDYAGEEFMRTVFHLESGQVGVALNAPQTVAYVVRLSSSAHRTKCSGSSSRSTTSASTPRPPQDDRQQIVRAWLDEIKSSAGVEWKRKPDRMTESGPRGED